MTRPATDPATTPPATTDPATAIGLGTAAIGGLYEDVGEATARATLEAAWASGIRYFDTAPHYGAGVAERRLGEFLRTRPRAEFTVSSKLGRLLRPGADGLVRVRDYSADGVYTSIAESLDRTGLDRFDTLFIHDPDDHWEAALGAAYPALARLREEGAVDRIGVGMNQAAMLARFVAEADLDCVLVAGRYTLLDRTAATELLPRCAERGVAVVAGGVFNSGVLADPGPDAHFDYLPVPPEVREKVTTLAAACARHGIALPAAALQFPLRHKAVTSLVLGARTPAEVEQNARHLTAPIPEALWSELDGLAVGW
ncbi:aldo/keto reductase [Amycolatopsis rhabdoformis]|uniref:Aldo/keto reductase n=1 Tax=Amycolatopsis rhabdoformis TaxID=1448059 RepID=A0ABZ1IBZ6_9PSEU|nr:aldo/keto reductase [Amycolatopsis rhabdoformis]WSE31950.1 aldo/keto reductase [Amycolatopsis rhabdoformis]